VKRDRTPPGERKETLREVLTVREAAAYAGCHEETIRRAYSSGQLRVQRFGERGWRVRRHDLDDWLDRGARTRSASTRAPRPGQRDEDRTFAEKGAPSWP
jgi:excisionase family DNA binding protein